jgi:uncharacterized protein YjiS (DUF1127 family)
MSTIMSGLLPGPEGGPGWRTEHERAYALPAGLRGMRAGDGASTTPAAIGLLRMLMLWRMRASARRELVALDARTLRDIGITRLDVVREVGKPVPLD